jgi:FlaA1/EpsC-like NDP-sugar epimerase
MLGSLAASKESKGMKDKLILVAGGGGFIGGHLVAHFRNLVKLKHRHNLSAPKA